MIPFDPIKILSFYLLIYIKFVYTADDQNGVILLPPYEVLYPNSLSFSIQGNTAYHLDGFMKIFRYEKNEWKSVFSAAPEPKSINVRYKNETTSYNCKTEGKVYTYTPKDNKLFSVVRNELSEKEVEIIWALTGAIDYATKVVYDETDPDYPVTEIYYLNGTTRKFTKQYCGEWRENEVTTSYTKLREDKLQIKVRSESEIPNVKIDKNDDYLKYSFYKGTTCLGVEYDRQELLKTFNTYPNTPYLNSVIFSTKAHSAIFNFDKYINILGLFNNNWMSFYSGEGEGKSINVQYKKDSDKYNCTMKKNVYTYTSKDNALFNVVRSQLAKDNEDVLFETDDPFKMVNIVEYDEGDPDYLTVTTHHVNGLTRKFVKPRLGNWMESQLSDPWNSLSVYNEEILNHKEKSRATPLPTTEAASKVQSLRFLDQSKIKIFAQDPKDSKKTVECDSSMYTLEIIEKMMVTYELNKLVDCVEVRYDNKVAWRFNPPKDKEYPKCVHFLLTGPIVVEMTDDLFYFSVRKSNGNFESIPMGKFVFDMDEVKLITTDSKFDPIPLGSNSFDSIPHKFFLEYKLKSDAKCEALYIEGKYPWIYNENIYGQYPSTMYLFPNEVLVMCGGKAFIQRFDPNNLGQFYMPREIIRPALAEFKFEKKNGYLFYELHSRVNCVGVNYDDKEVWKRDSENSRGPFPKSIMFAIRGKTAIVKFVESIQVIRLTDDGWAIIYNGNPSAISLDISAKLSNASSVCEKKGNVHTYTAIGDHLFGGVKSSAGFYGPDKPIWTAGYREEFSNKVVYDKSDGNNYILEIYQVNGLIKKFEKPKNGKWVESQTSDSEDILSQDKVEILTRGLLKGINGDENPGSSNGADVAPKYGATRTSAGGSPRDPVSSGADQVIEGQPERIGNTTDLNAVQRILQSSTHSLVGGLSRIGILIQGRNNTH